MVTILENVSNFSTAIGELYLVDKPQSAKVWTAMFVMEKMLLVDLSTRGRIACHESS
ncbi:hypothetical protein MtrunA17_Chr5g0431791 [Medicago truncatula]|uniref:Uncharacterized protein n=1 Tax=Medicago truncatula TaxID=3880 RepID=I3S8U4_MEDTR|nr:unknown [Medicago truncatula]RHN56655.1 hypothetical protein MtrunA17_Chr5g0431791 [Medicago truncatula]